MKKGQVSFDIGLAIIALLIVIQGINGITLQMEDSTTEISIRAQEKQIALDLARVLSYKEAIEEKGTDNYSIEYVVPKIFVKDKGYPIECEIEVTADEISVIVNNTHYFEMIEGKEIKTTIERNGNAITTMKCGEQISFS
jgi:hypothetical protein